MTDNPYAPPETNPTNLVKPDIHPDLYIVSKTKFYFLFIATLGLYQVYWAYKNWSLYRDATGEKIWPVPRAIFQIFFFHSLFRIVQGKLDHAGKSFDWNPTSHATIMVLLAVFSNILDRLAGRSIGSPYTDWLSLVFLFIVAIALQKAQAAINTSCGDPEGTKNASFTGANYFWIVIGIVLWFFIIWGLFLPDQGTTN